MEIDKIIKKRKTEKIIAEKPWEVTLGKAETQKLVDELLDLAVSAPCHYRMHHGFEKTKVLNSHLPYRFYVLDAKKCRETAKFIEEQGIEAGKIKNMLFSADVTFIVTFIPDPDKNSSINEEEVKETFEGNIKNMEHIAAASSAIQNILIGATAREISNYWSSGGQLRKKNLRNYLQIPLDEIILGTVFLFPKDSREKADKIIPGGLRDLDKDKKSWSKWVS